MQDQAPKRQTCGILGVLLAMLHWSKLHKFRGSQIDLSENKVPQMAYRVRYLIARNGWYTSFSDTPTCLKSSKTAFSMNAMLISRRRPWREGKYMKVPCMIPCQVSVSFLHSENITPFRFPMSKKNHWFSVPLLSGHLGVCPIFRQAASKMVKIGLIGAGLSFASKPCPVEVESSRSLAVRPCPRCSADWWDMRRKFPESSSLPGDGMSKLWRHGNHRIAMEHSEIPCKNLFCSFLLRPYDMEGGMNTHEHQQDLMGGFKDGNRTW